jgi:hypothetical protein
MDNPLKSVFVVLLFLTVAAFVTAAVTELRANAPVQRLISRLIPICCGLFAAIALVSLQAVFPVTPLGSIALSRAMTLACAVIACSGTLITYSRRRTAVLMAVGGLVLAFFWMFNVVLA